MTDALKAALERLESAPLRQFWSEPICIQELRMKPGVHNHRLHQKGCWHKPFRSPRRFRFAHFPKRHTNHRPEPFWMPPRPCHVLHATIP